MGVGVRGVGAPGSGRVGGCPGGPKAHLGAVEDHGAHHVGLDAAVEAGGALRLVQRTCAKGAWGRGVRRGA